MVWIALCVFCSLGALALAAPWLFQGGAARSRGFYLSVAMASAVTVGAFAIYAQIGAPEAKDLPLAERAKSEGMTMGQMIAQAEARLRENPNDVAGWSVIAPVYRQAGRLGDAIGAYDKALTLTEATSPAAANLRSGRIETLLLQSQGAFSDPITKEIAAAITLYPDHPRLNFLQAMQIDQAGSSEQAVEVWTAFVSKFDGQNIPTLPAARQRLAILQGPAAEPQPAPAAPATAPLRGPSAADIEAAQAMSAGDRQMMIEGMVASLAARLEDEPNDIAGWERLINSYIVLGKADEAAAAFETAEGVFKGDNAALSRLAVFENRIRPSTAEE